MFSDSSKLDIMDTTKMTPKSFLQSITVFSLGVMNLMHPDYGKGPVLGFEGLGCFFVAGREPNRLTHVSLEHFHLTYLDFGMLEDFGGNRSSQVEHKSQKPARHPPFKNHKLGKQQLKSFTQQKNEVGGFSCNLFEEI